MSEPGISVIIPAFNAARYLGEALESVRAQTLQPLETIVVDNASTDATPEIARQWGTRCEHEPRRGGAHARNRGAAAARGNFFAMLDADDLCAPQRFEWQMEALLSDPRLEAAFGLMEQFRSPDLAPAEAAAIHCPTGAQPARMPNLMMIRREAFERVGPFSPDMGLADIVEWFARAEAAGLRHAVVPHVVLRRRLHLNNTGRGERATRGDYLRAIKQKLDRERAAGTGGAA